MNVRIDEMINRIKRIEEPEDKRYRGGTYKVWVEEWDDPPIFMHKTQLDVLRIENEMLKLGVPELMIERHRSLVVDFEKEEEAEAHTNRDI